MLTQYAFSILFIDKKKAKFSNDRFGFMALTEFGVMVLTKEGNTASALY